MATATATYVPKGSDQLGTLDIALDKERMKEAFVPMLEQHMQEDARLVDLDIEIMRQRNHRCVIRYRVHALANGSSEPIEWRVVGKVFRPNYGEKVYSDMQELWRNGFARNADDNISIPEALAFSTPLCMLFQEEIPGVPIKALLKENPQTEHFRHLARILAKLHRTPMMPTKAYTVRDHLMRCHPKHGFLPLALPDLGDAVDYIVQKSAEIEKSFGDYKKTPLHGDFHLGQVHLENGYAWLIDFDALSYGDPAADLGNLLVFLKQRARRSDAVQQVLDAFLDEYFSSMDSSIAERIPLYEGLTHLRRACKSLRLQQDGWEERTRRMVAMGVASIDEMLSRIEKAEALVAA